MAKNLQIQLEFTTKGSKGLIEALKKLAAEQNKVSAAQRKFNNANLKAVTATKRLLMAEEKHRSAMTKNARQISILNRRLEKLNFANRTLGITTNKAAKAQGRMRLSTAGLQRRLGVIRNKILLVTFAFGGLAAGIASSIKTSMQFEAVKVRLNAMFGSVEKGEKAFRKFNQIAATTPFTLTDVVEAGAALKAFGTNAEEMIKPTADLAAFMGTNATEAAQALGRAFAGGAGAADILRERGILQLIRDSKGIEDLSQLTLPQFRKALEETLLDPSVGIAGATDALSRTMLGMVSNMQDAFTRMKAAIGDFIDMKGVIQTLTGAFQNLGEKIRQASETPFETSIRHLQEMNIETTELELSQARLLETRMRESGAVLSVADAEKIVNTRLKDREEETLKLAKMRQAMVDSGFTQADAEKLITMSYIDQAKALSELFKGEEKNAMQVMFLAKLKRDGLNATLAEIHAQEDAVALSESLVEQGLITQNQAIEYQALLAKIFGLEQKITGEKKKQGEETTNIFKLTQEQKDDLKEITGVFMKQFNAVISLQKQNLDQRIANEIKALKKTDEFRNASMEKRQSMEDDIRARFAKEQQKLFEMQKKMSIAQIIIDTTVAINKLIQSGLAASLFDPTAPFRAKAITAGMLALGAKQIDLVSQQQAPAFARGGSFTTEGEQFIRVGDNSGGRERVDITPLSSPDFGDAGGGSSINVNIMGNVIGTQEFVRDNLLPEIENTIKRNLA